MDFSLYPHSPKGSCLYLETSSHSWDVLRYNTLKNGITGRIDRMNYFNIVPVYIFVSFPSKLFLLGPYVRKQLQVTVTGCIDIIVRFRIESHWFLGCSTFKYYSR